MLQVLKQEFHPFGQNLNYFVCGSIPPHRYVRLFVEHLSLTRLLFERQKSQPSCLKNVKNEIILDIATGGQLTEFHLTESVDRKFLIKQAFDRNCV
jgi:hypothetical protein